MKIQTSRESHRADQRYSGVYQQQGRMITDADWNELMDIVTQRRREALGDVVQYGVPREGGLAIDPNLVPGLLIRPGHLYAGGVLARLPGTSRFPYSTQPDFPAAPPTPSAPTPYRVYADVWDRTITSLQDTALRDPALHGADTCARAQTLVQVKWCPESLDPEDPAVNPPCGNARLTLELRSTRASDDPCDPCSAAELGEDPSRIGNYLFRVEVHDAVWNPVTKQVTSVTLKWSSENGAEQYALDAMPAGFTEAGWAWELLNDTTERHLGVHLATGTWLPSRGELHAEFPEDPDPAVTPLVRRWDGFVVLTRSGTGWDLEDGGVDRGHPLTETGNTAADGYVELGTAFSANLRTLVLTVELDRIFVAGDYWTAAVREEVHALEDVVLDAVPPTGVIHRYLTLGHVIYHVNGGPPQRVLAEPATDALRRRLEFPSLTTLQAGDVGLDNNCTGLYGDAENVQQALDNLCDIDASDVAYDDPECSLLSDGRPNMWTLFQQAITAWPNLDADGQTTVKKVLDSLFCQLDAGKIPYNPKVRETDWQDIVEVGAGGLGTPPAPNTVQDALDTLVEKSREQRHRLFRTGDVHAGAG
jgi:hypothetical protein